MNAINILITAEEAAALLDRTDLEGTFTGSVQINSAVALDHLDFHTVAFAMQYDEHVVIRANVLTELLLIACPTYAGQLTCPHIISNNPRRDFARLLSGLLPSISSSSGIHATALIADGAGIGNGVSIGAYCVIGENVKIGDGTAIYNHVSITGTVIIGENCTIKSGAVIGEEGFGFVSDKTHEPLHFPHLGRIEIGDRVFIGSNSTIERAGLDVTLIMDDVKIDDLVQIGHNCTVGKGTMVMCGAVLCGGTVTGDGCWVAPNSTVKQKLHIGHDSVIGLGSVVIKNVEAGVTVAGNPAKPLPEKNKGE